MGSQAQLDSVTSQLDEFLKLSTEERIRGETLPDIEKRCLDLCSTYIGGSWSKATSPSDLTVKRISGGLTNQLYHVHLNSSVVRVKNSTYQNEPSDVAIKFYQEKHIKNYSEGESARLNDMIILTIVSQLGIGPKVYGIFADGYIQGFYKHEQFRVKQQQDPKLLQESASILARFHNLNVPIHKEGTVFFQEMRNMLNFAYSNLQAAELTEQLNLQQLKARDLRLELDELLQRIANLNSPIVFSHNDFRGSNLLVTEPESKILLCDYDYCSYGPRGFDFATFLTEWGKKDWLDVLSPLPTESQMEPFLKYYIEASGKLVPGYANQPGNSLTELVKETKVMFLANYMFFLCVSIHTQESMIPSMPFDVIQKMYGVEHLYKFYIQLKQSFIADGTIGLKI